MTNTVPLSEAVSDIATLAGFAALSMRENEDLCVCLKSAFAGPTIASETVTRIGWRLSSEPEYRAGRIEAVRKLIHAGSSVFGLILTEAATEMAALGLKLKIDRTPEPRFYELCDLYATSVLELLAGARAAEGGAPC
jgi:hypothetical protein